MKTSLLAPLAATIAVATAGMAPMQASAGETFGTGNHASIYVDAAKFINISTPGCGLTLSGSGGYFRNECLSGSSSSTYYAPFELPEGARITNVYVHYYDNDAAGSFTHEMLRLTTKWNGGGTPVSDFNFGGTGLTSTDSTDYQMSSDTPSPALVYDTYDNTTQTHSMYALRISLTASNSVRYRGSWILYQRTIAPAPATATFNDVPTTHPFFNEVQQLVKSGITQGCGGGNYCPDASVTRGQMAAFLSRALGLDWDFNTNPS